MRNTRYYELKNDGYFFAKAGKDYTPVEGDGSEMRPWRFGDKTGETLGWKKKSLTGLIESAYHKSFENEDGMQEYFNIGLQAPDGGVDVLTIKLYGGDTLGVCQVLPSINLNKPVTFGIKDGKPYTFTRNGKEISVNPKNITVDQDGTKMQWQWPWDKENREFTGLPKPTIENKRGTEVKNTEDRDNVFYEAIKTFCDQVEIACAGLKDKREDTPAEVQAASAEVAEAPF